MYQQTSYTVEGITFQSYKGLKQGCPLSPLLFAIYISELDNRLEKNCLGGLVIGGKKVFCLAFADDLILMAKSPSELKDMGRALARFAKAKELEINEEKTKVLVFNKGSRSTKERWEINSLIFEEVKSFVYLGIVFQQNGEFTKHHRAVSRKANGKATEVWSTAERLFTNSYRTRIELFKSIVLPIILYGAEVTGYGDLPEYEKILRRYLRWTLGLPNGTKNAVVEVESGLSSIGYERFKTAARYENNIYEKDSELLQAAHKAATTLKGHKWASARRCRWQHLGWSTQETDRRMAESYFWRLAAQRFKDQEDQRRREECRKIPWYVTPKESIPMYLCTNSTAMKIVARFRCGAETPGDSSWRTATCRICNSHPETAAHLEECGGQGDWSRLVAENGRGLEGMKAILLKRL